MVKNIITVVIILVTGTLAAQDLQFTQFYTTPMVVNPALIGTFNGTYRVGLTYRDQWRSGLQKPYTSYVAGGDVKFPLGQKREVNPNIAALGIQFFRDKIDILDFNTNQVSVTGAYHQSLNKKKSEYLGIGIQGSISQKAVNYEDLVFPDQFNAIDGYTLPTGEVLPPNNFGYLDLSIGVNYAISPQKSTRLNVGFSLAHIANQNISFFEKDILINPTIDTDTKIGRRLALHGSYSFATNEFFIIDPRILFVQQNQLSLVNFSTLFKVKIPGTEGRTFFAGPGVKLLNNGLNTGVESFILTGGLEFKGLLIGLSYDHNIRDLSQFGSGLSTFEFSIIYLGDYENADAFCPTF